jgi:hypothetical protein
MINKTTGSMPVRIMIEPMVRYALTQSGCLNTLQQGIEVDGQERVNRKLEEERHG